MFIDFWSKAWTGAEYPEEKYEQHIRSRPLSRKSVRGLFEWKNGTRLSERKQNSVEANFVARVDELSSLPEGTTAEQFLTRFDKGGAIFRIFWLHIWQPHQFPIFDQHVWRAMGYLNRSDQRSLSEFSDHEKESLYLEQYLPWFTHTMGNHAANPRADRALWRFGQFLSRWRLDMSPERFTDLPAITVIK
jgi:hypothetical protein